MPIFFKTDHRNPFQANPSLDRTNLHMLSWGLGLAALIVLLLYDQCRFGLNVPPSGGGDEAEYDSLGWELSQGRGFQIRPSDPVFRKPYDNYWRNSPEHALPVVREGTTASRPPLYPLILAGLNNMFGRQFWSPRVLNATCLAVTCGLLVSFLIQSQGWKAAWLGAFLFVVVDTRTRLYGRTLLTEPLAVIFTTLLLLLLARDEQRPTFRNAAMSGALLGLMVLTRSQFIFWAPPLILLVAWLIRKRSREIAQRETWRIPAAHAAVFTGSMLLVLAPWMIRNCLVLREAMPLGTQGAAQLPAGFSDGAWELRGYWKNLVLTGTYDAVLHPGMTRLEEEIAMAKSGNAQAQKWIRQHPVKALLLIPLKVRHELLAQSPIQIALLIFAGVGGVANWHLPGIRIGCWLFACNSLAVGLTWSVDDGRFFVPLIFLEDALATLGLMRVIQSIQMRCQFSNMQSSKSRAGGVA